MKKILIILFVFVFSSHAFPQLESDTIYWSPCYKLKWDDFQGKPDTPSKYGAVSNPIIKYSLSANEESFSVKVTCFFIKSRSWSIFKKSDTLLMHEQGHFDISELFARKLKKAFAEYKFNYKTVRTDLNNLFLLNKKEKLIMNSLYDKETNLSRNGKQQLFWIKKIKAELDKLKEYSTI